MSHPNEKLIHSFYQAFQAGDAEGMAACYHPEISFSDPVFQDLRGKEAGDMWRMLLSRATGNLNIRFSDIQADDQSGRAHWEADYPFGPKKRMVHNKIQATFRFREGKIVEHHDHFSFRKWASMALGPMGKFFGWAPFVKSAVRKKSRSYLRKFQAK
ncbi:MAG: nuclear transport factor 2 family protein [Bacteroidetes bacterium]|nr:nuclear transport factor 2 family protein [Bacteroidota bacterium]